eukprot:COSAG05_NODE_3950_length_1754_cov_42.892607_2_plen_121_part_00
MVLLSPSPALGTDVADIVSQRLDKMVEACTLVAAEIDREQLDDTDAGAEKTEVNTLCPVALVSVSCFYTSISCNLNQCDALGQEFPVRLRVCEAERRRELSAIDQIHDIDLRKLMVARIS